MMILKKVRVYWNLHSKIWSVQDSKSGLVIDHVSHISLEDAKFIVRKGGQERVRREGKKNVHAFAVGYITPLGDKYKDKTFKWYRVTYNPYKNDYFMLGKYEIERDWIGNIHMESMVHEHGVASRVYV